MKTPASSQTQRRKGPPFDRLTGPNILAPVQHPFSPSLRLCSSLPLSFQARAQSRIAARKQFFFLSRLAECFKPLSSDPPRRRPQRQPPPACHHRGPGFWQSLFRPPRIANQSPADFNPSLPVRSFGSRRFPFLKILFFFHTHKTSHGNHWRPRWKGCTVSCVTSNGAR